MGKYSGILSCPMDLDSAEMAQEMLMIVYG